MDQRMMDRRDFMKSGIAGVGGFVFLASSEKKQEERTVEGRGQKRKFIYRTLGKTGVQVPVISMGALYTVDPALIRAALDAGVVHLETANIHRRGENELMIGAAIKGRPRDSYLITTKLFFMFHRVTGLYGPEVKEEMFHTALDTSLKRMGLDYIDFLYIHDVWKRESVTFEPLMKGMEKAKKDGKVRFCGVTAHRNEPEVIQAVIDSKFYDLVYAAYNFRQKHFLEVKQAMARAAEAGIGVLGMKSMGGTASFQDVLRPVNAKAALKWVLQDPNVHTVIVAMTTFDEVDEDLEVMADLALTDEEKKYLRTAAAAPGLYCQGCGQCVKQCLARLPIPDLMRAYMYTYGYRKPSMGQEVVVSLGLPSQVCGDCGPCPVKCSIGFDVPGKIKDVTRLRDVPRELIV